jgi:hypothetical protein
LRDDFCRQMAQDNARLVKPAWSTSERRAG